MANDLTTRLWTTAELYPPKAPEGMTTLLDGILLGDRLEDGRAALRRVLDEDERSALAHRHHDLGKWLKPARAEAIAHVVLIMMVGFGKAETEAESAVRVTRYCEILADLPLWAIKRACDRFGAGEVTAEELGEKNVMRGRAPSTDHLYRIAAAIVAPLRREATRCYFAMNGGVPKAYGEKTEEGKARVQAALEAFRRRPDLPDAEEAERRREEARERLAREAKEFSDAMLAAEFEALGIEPPKGFPVSLGLLVQHGAWVEETREGYMVLTKPPRSQMTRRRPTEPNEMGS